MIFDQGGKAHPLAHDDKAGQRTSYDEQDGHKAKEKGNHCPIPQLSDRQMHRLHPASLHTHFAARPFHLASGAKKCGQTIRKRSALA